MFGLMKAPGLLDAKNRISGQDDEVILGDFLEELFLERSQSLVFKAEEMFWVVGGGFLGGGFTGSGIKTRLIQEFFVLEELFVFREKEVDFCAFFLVDEVMGEFLRGKGLGGYPLHAEKLDGAGKSFDDPGFRV